MFAFYDLETTGTSPAFDQPLQFAAILTDNDLNEVERVNIRCRLAPHILPAPWALAVTGISPDQLVGPALPSWFECSHQTLYEESGLPLSLSPHLFSLRLQPISARITMFSGRRGNARPRRFLIHPDKWFETEKTYITAGQLLRKLVLP
ncbi:hypothetical protein DS901_02465 [Loktanella sp. D2R18]|uniref:exonuclease domain-containing protein n=1 Tax=Rhodobacterales TaxID=204455 RepID=UPI000DEBCA3F|nr:MULTISPECIES: exonuclease domain-containing protein [Rhodobacterales]MDO6591947.1 exonuclease domain-containing protein [Yoonia sp. 1_MG-2023]RBW45646.1 hypothetical protein DS901_02465 [Loktanella sp. D2R18]